MTDDAPAAEGPLTITITFTGPGAAACSIEAADGVEPAQVYAAAFLFDVWAREVRMQTIAAMAQRAAAAGPPRILVPTVSPNRQARRHPAD